MSASAWSTLIAPQQSVLVIQQSSDSVVSICNYLANPEYDTRLILNPPVRGNMTEDQTYDFFFYGTLMHPSILTRVIGHAGEDLSFQDCILPGYVRHCVKDADYPAVIPVASSSRLLQRELTDEEACVRGTLVKGLKLNDVLALDAFEGDEYVRVHLTKTSSTSLFFAPPAQFLTLSAPSASTTLPANHTITSKEGNPSPQPNDPSGDIAHPSVTLAEVQQHIGEGKEGYGTSDGWVYVWAKRDESGRDVVGLEEDIWDFQSFLREKSHRWTGHHPDANSTAAADLTGLPPATEIMSGIRATTGVFAGKVEGRDEEEFRAADEVRERLRRQQHER